MKVDKSLKVCGIYSIFNKINGFEYIGSSKLVYKRIGYHFSSLRGNRHTNRHLQNSFNKYGEDSFGVKLLEICTLDNLKSREEYYILSTPNRYNSIDKPTGPLKLPTHSAERRARMSQIMTGRKITEVQRKRFSESHKGLKNSEESKQKTSIALKAFYSIEENKHYPTEESLAKSRETFLEKHPDGRRLVWTTLICPQCHNEFELQPHLAKRTQYCSNACRAKSMIGRTLSQDHKDKLKEANNAFLATDKGKVHLGKLLKAAKENAEKSKIPLEIRTCLCGCGETFEVKINSKKLYVLGHFKIKNPSQQIVENRRQGIIKFYSSPEGQALKKKMRDERKGINFQKLYMKQTGESNAN